MLILNLFEELEGPPEPTLIDALRDFLPLAIKHLELKKLPKIKLLDEVETEHMPSFGKFSNDDRTIHLGIKNRHPNDILRTLAHEMVHYAQGQRDELDADSGATGSPEEDQANAEAGVIMREFNQQFPQYMELKPIMLEKWSKKYKKSINCSNPKGFSQKAHCAGRKARKAGKKTKSSSVSEGKITNAALVAMLATALSSGPAHADFNYPQQKEPSAVAKALGIARKINSMKGYGPEAAQAEAQQELNNLIRALGNQGNNNSRIYPLIKDMVKNPGPLPTTAEELPQLIDEPTNENFADGKKPGRKGLAKRSGVNCKASVSSLRKTAKNSSGEKRRMAHWCANMKSGRAK